MVYEVTENLGVGELCSDLMEEIFIILYELDDKSPL